MVEELEILGVEADALDRLGRTEADVILRPSMRFFSSTCI
jgi:hypothetical protein